MTVKEFVIETLRHTNISRINFQYGPIRVYPLGYSRDVAKLVEDGHIVFDTGQGAHYTVDAQPGTAHRMALPAEHTHRKTGVLSVKPSLGGPGFRGSIVHEATHALQDYQRNQTDDRTAEGAAYLAGWMTSVLWGYPRLPSSAARTTGHAYARWLAGRCIDGRIGYVIPDAEVRALNRLVTTGSAHRYIFNGI